MQIFKLMQIMNYAYDAMFKIQPTIQPHICIAKHMANNSNTSQNISINLQTYHITTSDNSQTCHITTSENSQSSHRVFHIPLNHSMTCFKCHSDRTLTIPNITLKTFVLQVKLCLLFYCASCPTLSSTRTNRLPLLELNFVLKNSKVVSLQSRKTREPKIVSSINSPLFLFFLWLA